MGQEILLVIDQLQQAKALRSVKRIRHRRLPGDVLTGRGKVIKLEEKAREDGGVTFIPYF